MGQQVVPGFLREKLNRQYGEDTAAKIFEGYQKERPVTIRVNRIKTDLAAVMADLDGEGVRYQKVPWYSDGLIVETVRELALQKMPVYKNGEIYLQSLSSMIPPLVLEPGEGDSVLDMAAAPGGKTTQIAALTRNMASITACERNKIRGERLQYNIDKQGASRVCVLITDARRLDDFFSFDKILLDAPCTGSGTFSLSQGGFSGSFTKAFLNQCTALQEGLLKKALKLLKPGHEMVYSTCSVLEEENEAVLRRVLPQAKAEIVPVQAERFSGVSLLPATIPGVLCICPDNLYEGFFVAKIRKR